MTFAVMLALALAPIVSACTRGAGGGGTTLAAARERLKDLVDSTADAVAGDLRSVPAPPVPRVACDDHFGDDETFVDGYALRFEVPDSVDPRELVETTAAHWRAEGFEVKTTNLDSSLPSAFAGRDGYQISIEVVATKKLAEIGGSTPCLPAEGSAADA